MARINQPDQPCRVCGGETESFSPYLDHDRDKGRPKRRCVDPDCVGYDWWVQAVDPRG